jgi:hypothetical protein
MKKNIYIHIGWHKTGTTSVQDFLLKNRLELIGREKVYYPNEGMLICAHHTIAWAFQDKKTSPWGPVNIPVGGAEGLIESIKDSANAQGCETVIISSEEFCTFNSRQIIALYKALEKNDFEAKVVAYIRRQDQLIESAYNMEVKWWGSRLKKDFSEYLKERTQYINYTPVIEQWAEVFGVKNIIIRPFSQEKLEGSDVRIDFCKALNIDIQSLSIRAERVNDSLASQTLEFVRVMNNLDISRLLSGTIEQKLLKYDELNKLSKCVLFTPDERINFMANLNESNKTLKKFANNVDFMLPPRDELPDKNVKPLSIEAFTEIFRYVFEEQDFNNQ